MSSALLGNTVLLAQPTTGAIQKQMPPPCETVADGLAVMFTTSREDVKKAKVLQVSRSQYLECANLRKNVCYAFCDARVDEQHANELLPEAGVPEMFVEEAVHMTRLIISRRPWMDPPN